MPCPSVSWPGSPCCWASTALSRVTSSGSFSLMVALQSALRNWVFYASGARHADQRLDLRQKGLVVDGIAPSGHSANDRGPWASAVRAVARRLACSVPALLANACVGKSHLSTTGLNQGRTPVARGRYGGQCMPTWRFPWRWAGRPSILTWYFPGPAGKLTLS